VYRRDGKQRVESPFDGGTARSAFRKTLFENVPAYARPENEAADDEGFLFRLRVPVHGRLPARIQGTEKQEIVAVFPERIEELGGIDPFCRTFVEPVHQQNHGNSLAAETVRKGVEFAAYRSVRRRAGIGRKPLIKFSGKQRCRSGAQEKNQYCGFLGKKTHVLFAFFPAAHVATRIAGISTGLADESGRKPGTPARPCGLPDHIELAQNLFRIAGLAHHPYGLHQPGPRLLRVDAGPDILFIPQHQQGGRLARDGRIARDGHPFVDEQPVAGQYCGSNLRRAGFEI